MRRLHTAAALLLGAALGSVAPGAQAADAEQLALGRAVFESRAVPACKVCHTLAAANATGAVGPVLDELKPDAERVEKAVRNGLGAMPSFRDKLSDAEIAAVARFVAVSSGGAR